ncbi:hypothetical protein NDU88_006239 [Pleurodeles waltl]|uniref:Reverse transcriptase domain-containing protein n=1 Tax=Pleurodeles waltl TaxID=8319 RepID=A0AAV7PI26_PLEWA|nr:hypothetical protein NDU88_006239 [Pleurodeles waltl]
MEATDKIDQTEVVKLKKQWNEADERLRKFDYRRYTARLKAKGDCSSRLLAWLVKGEQQHTPINAIHLESETIVNTKLEINEAFRQYYDTLYKAGPPPSPDQIREFFRLSPLTDPKAGVKTGAVISKEFVISPLLFALAIDPIAARLRNEAKPWGIPDGSVHRIISLYADDALIYLCDWPESLPQVLQLLNFFGKLSGLCVNWSKSWGSF